jgi:hypothetical protein
MSKEESEDDSEEKSEGESIFVEGEFFHDSIGVSYFLPKKRCKNCDD